MSRGSNNANHPRIYKLKIYTDCALILWIFLLTLLYCPQTSPTMSRKSRLSREDIEVHEALSETDSESIRSAPLNPGQGPQNDAPTLNSLSLQLTQVVQSLGYVTSELNLLKQSRVSPQASKKRKYAPDERLPLPVVQPEPPVDPGIMATAPRFGLHANPPPPVVRDVAVDVEGPLLLAQEVLDPAPVPQGIVLPDPRLPTPGSVLPPNFFPEPEVMAWVVDSLDTVVYTAEDRKTLKSQFVPSAEHAHVFEPVSMPQEILDAMKHKTVTESDYLFNRYAAELSFYKANNNLTAGYGPLLQVISNLTGDESREEDRFMLGNVFFSMVASVDMMSRGRRELARRFVPLENAPSLLKSKPTHTSIFGGVSTESAVEVAVKAAKSNKDLVYKPKFQYGKKPFPRGGSVGRGFHRYPVQQKTRGYYSQQYQYPARGRYQQGAYQQGGYYQPQSQKRGQRGGRGGGGNRGKRRQSGAASYNRY